MKKLGLAVTAASDVGRKRPQNEDCHAVWIPEQPAERDRRGVLLVVADGMGGMSAGEVASRLTVETVVRVFRESEGRDVPADLRRAIEEANRVVHEMSRSNTELVGMGTTCTAVVVRGDSAWIGHVGDSRAYLIRGETIRQLTQDHSLVVQLVERRELTEEQARRDPRRNVVTRSIGPGEEVEVDARAADFRLQPGDALMVCSDGLHGQLTDADMADLVATEEQSAICGRLIAEANDRGGPDNITVVVARLEAPARSSRGRAHAAAGVTGDVEESAPAGALVVHPLLLALFAATLVLAFVMWLLNRHGATL